MIPSQGDCDGCVVDALFFHPMLVQWLGEMLTLVSVCCSVV